MDSPFNMPQARALTGEAHKRFTIVAALLSMIDPVRGEPTVHSLDRHPHDSTRKQEQLQKKFLDSFALWASQARWVYSEKIEDLFCPEGEELPVWINHIYKLGRYYVATKIMLKLATKQPDLFTAIHVEAVEAPEPHAFSLKNDKTALKTVLQRLMKTDDPSLMTKLGQLWVTEDPEARFHKACQLQLIVHAEMQLLTLYDHHLEFTPRLLFMGTSEKACFLCHRFMSQHPLTMSMSASHQKLYPSWMPAPCSASAVRKQHKVLLWELSRHLEQTAARDLETRLGIRRPNNPDSTAGPSMPTTESITSGQWSEYLASTAGSSLRTTESTSSGRWTKDLPIHMRV
ncbi:uncharacterized protein DNG_02238 [Cephalotrichum gorgonifer]|uniref:Uncharacterized protein n=1 Tax=Cephalotrichum gorgonifer TaxID=2041049 RepID=A0AAE8MT82_9PEZI|nr:uncharacterized protein DNG_02238 [Cephalotrichum gorgonifer]